MLSYELVTEESLGVTHGYGSRCRESCSGAGKKMLMLLLRLMLLVPVPAPQDPKASGGFTLLGLSSKCAKCVYPPNRLDIYPQFDTYHKQ